METENKVWVVTGEEYYDDDYRRVVLAVCPTKEDAENLRFQIELGSSYDEIWIEDFSVLSHSKPPIVYTGYFRLQVRPCSYVSEKYYILCDITNIRQNQKAMPATFKEKFDFSIGHIIKTDGPESYIISGEFASTEKAPTEGVAARQWLVQKINEKGLITLVDD